MNLTAQDPFNDLHSFRIRDAHALDKFALFSDSAQSVPDLRAAAVDDNRIHSDEFQKHDITGKSSLQLFFRHGVTAVFNHNRLAVKFLNKGKSL